jgi:multidrug efflux system outer membrane protein
MENAASMRTLLVTALLCCGLFACAVGPDYVRPDIETPEAFEQRIQSGESLANVYWFDLFQDDELRRLINIALVGSKDLAIATARVEETRARLGITRADQFPRIGVAGGANRGNTVEQFIPGAGVQNNFTLSAEVGFEIDLFGKLRRSTEAARAELLASEETRRTVLISLVADVAGTYFLLLDLDQRKEVAERTLTARSESTRIIRARFSQGTVPKIDVNQAEIQEADSVAELAALERQVVQAENLISILLGRNPGRVTRGQTLNDQVITPDVPAGLPADLLERRPDIRAAEQSLAAQTARIGVAKAARFPSISLTGSGGAFSTDLNDLLDSNAGLWSVGANILAPIYDAGQNRSRQEAEIARAEQLLRQYELTILQAFREVEDALVAIRTLRDETRARETQVVAARSAAFLSHARYDGGVTSYLEVLDAERSLFSAEIAASAANRAQLVSVVDLYKALGGGWVPAVVTNEQ